MIANRYLRWTAYAVAAILLLVVSGIVVLHTPMAQRFVRDQIASALISRGIGFESSRLEYNLFRLSVRLDDVIIQAPEARNLPPLARIDELLLNLGWRELLSGRIFVESATIRSPKLHLVITEDGRNNIPQLVEQQQRSGSTWRFLIDQLAATDASLLVEDRKRNVRLSLPLWRLSIDGNPSTEVHDVRLDTSRPGEANFEGRTLPVKTLSLAALLQQSRVEVQRFVLDTGSSQLNVSGAVKDFSQPGIDSKVTARLSLGTLSEFAGLKQDVAGNLDADLAISGTLNALKVSGTLRGEDLSVQKFDNLDLAAQATYDLAASKLHVTSFTLNSPSGRVQGDANVSLTTAAGASTVNARVQGMDLQRLSNLFDAPVQAASRATGTVQATWPGLEFKQATARANLRLDATRARAGKDVLPVSGSIAATMQGGSLQARLTDVRTLGARASGTVALDANNRLSGSVRADVADTNDLVQRLGVFLGRRANDPLVPTPISGPATLTANLGGTTKNPQLDAKLASPGLRVGDLQDVSVQTDLQYRPDQLTIRSAQAQWQNQTATVQGTVGLRGRAPQLNLTVNVPNVSLATALAAAGKGDIPAQGTVSIAAEVTGTTKNPVADAVVTGTNLQAYGEPLGELNARARFENQVLQIPEILLRKPDDGGTLTASATVDTKNRTYRLDANGQNLALRSLTLPDGTPIRGEIDLQAKGSGSFDDPQLTASLNAQNLTVRNEALGPIRADVNLANQQARVEAQAPQFNLSADATVGVKEPYDANFTIRADNTDLSKLPVTLPGLTAAQGLQGNVTATITGTAPLNNPELADITARIENVQVTRDGRTIRSDGPIQARYANRALTVDPSTIIADGSRLQIGGQLPLDGTLPGNLRIQGTFDVAQLLASLPQPPQILAGGDLTVDLTLNGTLKRFRPEGSVVLANAYVQPPGVEPAIQTIQLRAQIRDGAILLEQATALWAGAKIAADGRVPLAVLPDTLPIDAPNTNEPIRLNLDVAGLRLGAIKGVPERVSGTVSLNAAVESPTLNPGDIRARLTFPQLQLNLAGVPVEQQGTSTLIAEKGLLRVENFTLAGPQTRFQLAGTASLLEPRTVDVRVDGNLDAGILASFTDTFRAAGATQVQLAVRGTLDNPQASGFVQVDNLRASLQEPRLQIDDLKARVELQGDRVQIAQFRGTLNGGALEAAGGLRLVGATPRDVNISINANELYLEYPLELRTVSNAVLQLQSVGELLRLSGAVLVQEGSYTEDLNFDENILRALRSDPELQLTQERNPLLNRLRFNVDIETQSPLVVDNNLAKAEITADLRLTGTFYDYGLAGRLRIEEGGEIRLNERSYAVERGTITFTGERRIEPSLDILARTQASGYDITLQVQGERGDIETTLTSDPPLPEPDILAVLLTGRPLEEVRGAELDIARNQVLSYLTGRFGGVLTGQLRRAVGLSQVRIEPVLIAQEADPSARLTLGQEIARGLNLIYSFDLADPENQIWLAEYDITRRFNTRAVKQQDNTYRLEFRHDVRFGGSEPQRDATLGGRRPIRRVGNVAFNGNFYVTDEELAKRFKVKSGKTYNFFEVRRGLDRVEKLYSKRDLLEADIDLDRREQNGTVDLTLSIKPGPKVEFIYEGWDVPGGTRDDIRDAWRDGVFDAARAEQAITELRTALVKRDYLRPTIEYRITNPQPDVKRVIFDIQPGPRFSDVKLVFEGAQGLESERLNSLIEKQKLETAVYTNPRQVRDVLARVYRDEGFLDVKVNEPRYELDAQTRTGQVVIPIEEGPRFTVREIAFAGNTVYDDAALAAALPLKAGEAYLPARRDLAQQKLQHLYWEKGYNEAEFDYTISRTADGGLRLAYSIEENQQSVVQDIRISGNGRTSENLIRTQMALRPGDILNLDRLSESRRHLYRTGAYNIVDIVREPIEEADRGKPGIRPVRLNVKVQEIRPFQLRYGGFFDTERGPGGIADFSTRNVLGSARVMGFRGRYDRRFQEGRVYFNQPLLRRFPLETIGSLFTNRESTNAFIANRIGLSIIQEARWQERRYVLNYGYRLEQSRTRDRIEDPLFPSQEIRLRSGVLNATLIRETRDDILNATQGSFASQALEYGPEILGSDIRFLRYFGQYFKYFALGAPQEIPFTNGLLRPRLIYASAVRVGLAGGLGGQELIRSERFFAGGSTTVRGFRTDTLGPKNILGNPLGGDAVFILNQELRFPIKSIVDGTAFVDAGNVYPDVRDFRPWKLRTATGLGVRLWTPYFLLRLDYGINVRRKPGEDFGRFFFSIGQTF